MIIRESSFTELINCADLAFVARAVSKDDSRPQFWYMKIEEKDGGLLATATDGRRLHRAKLDKEDGRAVSPGYWRVLKNKMVSIRDYEVEEELGYLNYRVYKRINILWLVRLDKFDFFPTDDVINRVYPQGDHLKEGVIDTHNYKLDSMNALIKNLPDSAGINPRYLRDLGPYEWNYKIFSSGKPVLFEHKNKTALIAPVQIDF